MATAFIEREGISYPVIHTSDRTTFKKCRTQWDFVSPIRQNLQPRKAQAPLLFGSAIHEALADYYDPAFPNRSVIRAMTKFHDFIQDWWKSLGIDGQDEEARALRDESIMLGADMLSHYFESWARKVDNFEVL